MIVALVGDHGALSDLDPLHTDPVAWVRLNLCRLLEARWSGKWLTRLRACDVKGRWDCQLKSKRNGTQIVPPGALTRTQLVIQWPLPNGWLAPVHDIFQVVR